MLPIEAPFKTYTDLYGKPLNGGSIYIGSPNENPITSPITVYWDADGTEPALQPLRTLNGYIIRAGTPANVFVAGPYSELVLDIKRQQVAYAPSSDDFSMGSVINSLLQSVEERLASALTIVSAGDGTVPAFSVGTPSPGVIAKFQVTKPVTQHADYGYLYNSTVTYSLAGFYGHASFNDNVKFAGPQNSDHHHSFQSYPHYGGTGTIGRISGLFVQPEVTAGAVTELSMVSLNNTIGSGGAIGTQYGVKIAPLTRGNANYAIYAEGPTVSYFGGALVLGQIGTPAYVMYNQNSGNLDLIPRTGYGIAVEGPLLFGASTGTAAKIAYNINGNLDITPREGYHTTITAGSLLIGRSLPAAAEKVNVTAATSDFLVRGYNTDANPKGLALIYSGASPNGTGNEFLYCQDALAVRMTVLSNGNLQNANNSYGALSDVKLKENIVDASSKLDKLLAVRIVSYNLKADPDRKQLGVIAQELEKIFPGMIEESLDYEDIEVEPAKTVTTTTRRQKTAKREEVHIMPQLVDGQWRNVPTPIMVDAPVFDHYPLFDEHGTPLMELSEPAQAEVLDKDGKVVTPYKPEVYSDRQRVHQVPVMEEVTESIDVPARYERRATGEVTKSVKYSVFVPMLIKAMQEQQALIDGLKKQAARKSRSSGTGTRTPARK